MSQQYPSPPPPQQQWGAPPTPPQQRNWFARHKLLTGIGAVFAVVILFSAASGGEDTSADKNTPGAGREAAARDDAKPAGEPAEAKKKDLSQAEQFTAFVAENGTPREKEVVGHVTKVQGADEQNGFLDSAEVYTDYTGGLMGPHASSGKLIASAFADWKDSKNGLVTVYDESGELLSNGNF